MLLYTQTNVKWVLKIVLYFIDLSVNFEPQYIYICKNIFVDPIKITILLITYTSILIMCKELWSLTYKYNKNNNNLDLDRL